MVRRIPFAFDAVKEGRWSREDYRGNTLFGKTLGIIGYGRLGEIMARYGNALGMKVLAVDPYKQIDVRYAEPVSLDELLKRSDVISVHVHLNEETKGMIGRDEINRMKDGVIIINTARGAVIDEDAFVEGLICGKIGGAGIDVIADETLRNIKDTPLVEYARRHQNLVITPHIGGATIEAQKLTYLKIAEKVKTWISVKIIINALESFALHNPKKGWNKTIPPFYLLPFLIEKNDLRHVLRHFASFLCLYQIIKKSQIQK